MSTTDDDFTNDAGTFDEAGAESRLARPGREISETTRALFARASAAVKASLDGDAEADELEVLDTSEPAPAAAEAAPAPAPVTAAPAAAPAAPAEAPAAVVDADLVAERAQLEAERATLAAEREAWQRERAAADDAEAPEDFAGAVRDLMKRWTGASDDNALRVELADLVTELSSNVLGVPLAPAAQAEMLRKRTERMVRTHQAKLDKREREMAEKERVRAEAAEKAEAHRMLSGALTSRADSYPYLASEDDGATIVMSVVEAEFKRTGKMPAWEDAARRCEAALKSKADAWYQKRSKLFTAAAPAAPPASAPKSATSSGAALTNRGAAAAPQAEPAEVDAMLPNEERRRRSLAMLRARQAEAGANT